MESTPDRFAGPPPKEPVFNAPLLAVLLAVSMPALYFFQERSGDFWTGLSFAPVELSEGRYGGLVTSMLVHANWAHVLVNAVGALTFGAPVARLLRGSVGSVAFLALYICAGIFATLGFALVHWGSTDPLVGASGAVFGLIGAATRLLGGKGRLVPLTDGMVIKTSIAWMAVNVAVGLIGFAPGVEGARIAWEAHAFGFLFGILAIGPLGRVFGRTDERFASPDTLGDPDP